MRLRPTFLLALTATVACGCSSVLPARLTETVPVPAGPERPAELTPPAAPEAAPPQIPEHLLEPGAAFTLADIVEIALANNPVTRTSYLQALSAAADLGSKRSAYYPTLDLSVGVTRAKQNAFGGQFNFLQTSYGPTVTVNYLLFDLGGRAATTDEARLALLAADWTHSAAIQDVILGVQQTFVAYLSAKAQLKAAKAVFAEAQKAFDAANGRHDAGVATIAEVLQAKTALSQAQLAVDRLSGQVLALRGSLATAMGLPATTPYDVGNLPEDLPLDATSQTVEELVAQARQVRPDLAAARLRAEKADTHIRSVRSDGRPRLTGDVSASRLYFQPSTYASYGDSWSARVLLNVPLFTGFQTRYNVDKASQDAAAAASQADTLEQQVILEVWTSYYDLHTATQLVKTSRDLLASADQSEKVALGRYKEGVGTIIDLLTAQAALANARAQEIEARSTWFSALAQLSRDVGVASPTLKAAISVTEEKATP